MQNLEFRTPMKCQNGHFRFYYWKVKAGDVVDRWWGARMPLCKYPECPTGGIGEGFGEFAPDEMYIGYSDATGLPVYENDLVSDEYTVYQVVFKENRFILDRVSGSYQFPHLPNRIVKMTVIGNIREGKFVGVDARFRTVGELRRDQERRQLEQQMKQVQQQPAMPDHLAEKFEFADRHAE